MDYEERPNYPKIQSQFATALKSAGGKDDGTSVFLPSAGTPKVIFLDSNASQLCCLWKWFMLAVKLYREISYRTVLDDYF